jgi:hypothetical protein
MGPPVDTLTTTRYAFWYIFHDNEGQCKGDTLLSASQLIETETTVRLQGTLPEQDLALTQAHLQMQRVEAYSSPTV